MQLLSLLFVGVVGAATTFTHQGMTVSITHTLNGVEIPVEYETIDLHSNPLNKAPGTRLKGKRAQPAPSFSGNWCGGVGLAPPTPETWSQMQGAWDVPTISLRPGQTLTQVPGVGAASWIGFDGTSGCSTITQAGLLHSFDSTGKQVNQPVWAIDQGSAVALSNFPVQNGDAFLLIITKTSETSVTFNMGDFTNGHAAVINVDNAETICGLSVDWIMEAFTNGDGEVAFPDFTSFAFQNALATTNTGTTTNTGNAGPIELVQNGELVCGALVDPNNPIVVVAPQNV